MASTLFDLEVGVTSPGVTKGISDDSKNQLFRRPRIEKTKPKDAGTISRPQAQTLQESEILELDEISEAYEELIVRADSILEKLRGRSAGLTYVFDPAEEPALSEALGRVFQNSTDTITYDMYLAALRLDKDIAVEIGESEIGFTR